MYSFKQALRTLEAKGKLDRIKEKVSVHEIPGMIKRSKTALLFETTGTDYSVASNICTRSNFCTIFDMDWKEIQEKVIAALDNPIKPVTVDENPFEEVELDLGRLPILKYYDSDPGVYITSGVFVVECEKRNLAYHRILVKRRNTGTARICHRHTCMHEMWQNPSNAQEILAEALDRNQQVFEFEKVLTKSRVR